MKEPNPSRQYASPQIVLGMGDIRCRMPLDVILQCGLLLTAVAAALAISAAIAMLAVGE